MDRVVLPGAAFQPGLTCARPCSVEIALQGRSEGHAVLAKEKAHQDVGRGTCSESPVPPGSVLLSVGCPGSRG